MSCECKSISCLFQVFISPYPCFSLRLFLMIFLLHGTAPSPLSPTVTHIPLFCSFLFLLFSFNQPTCHSSSFQPSALSSSAAQREEAFMKKNQRVRQTVRRLTSWQRDRESLGVAAGIKVQKILMSIMHNIVVQYNNPSRSSWPIGHIVNKGHQASCYMRPAISEYKVAVQLSITVQGKGGGVFSQ